MTAATGAERATRHLVEVEVDGRWLPASTGGWLVRRLLVFDDAAEGDWWAAMLNARRGLLAYRVRPTEETDDEIRRRR